MIVRETPIPGVYVIERSVHGDDRGFLTRLFCAEALRTAGWIKPVAQINHTFTASQGTVRGMHFQHPPQAEMKLVSCVRGEIWDVAVDLRRGSPAFLQWHAERLSAENRLALLIPEGCAHGFQTMTDDCDLVYCHSAAHAPGMEGGVRYDDPALSITWPLPVCNISPRDQGHPLVTPGFDGLVVH